MIRKCAGAEHPWSAAGKEGCLHEKRPLCGGPARKVALVRWLGAMFAAREPLFVRLKGVYTARGAILVHLPRRATARGAILVRHAIATTA